MNLFYFQIWDLSDPSGKGFLDKDGFFVALKLIALAQNGHGVDVSNVHLTVPPPNMVSCFVLVLGFFSLRPDIIDS